MEESLVDVYIEKLENSNNKTQVMVEFLRSVLHLETISPNLYKIVGRLVSIYGYKTIFFSILDCVEVENINVDGIHRLISYFAKKRLSEKMTENPVENLTPLVVKNTKEMEKLRRIRIPKIDWEENV